MSYLQLSHTSLQLRGQSMGVTLQVILGAEGAVSTGMLHRMKLVGANDSIEPEME